MQTVYALKDDRQQIERIQQATLTTKKFGLELTHGLFGSDEWWNAIASGELPIHTLKGVISKVYMGSMNDWPMFALKDATGQEEHFTREANTPQLDSLYQEGRIAEMEYVWQTARKTFWNRGTDRKVVIAIRIEERDADQT